MIGMGFSYQIEVIRHNVMPLSRYEK